MPPPPAEPFATRIFLGPALRTQPDRRLVKLVREGYEAAFEEIVRRYRRPLDRFAAAFVGNRSEDVTQDAFSKALLALRGSEKEIELRPWLYRIVRNTALNDLRDQPRPIEELGEAVVGGESAAIEAERREEIRELMERLRALPEPQRAAIVMRELEGLSHEEIAAALGVSGGAARQAIHRARVTLRNGLGMLVPLPLLRMLCDHGAEVAGAGGAVAAAGAASAGGGGAALGGLGASGALKVGVATALLAGSVGAGVAIQPDRGRDAVPEPAAAEASVLRNGANGALISPGSSGGSAGQGPQLSSGDDRGRGGPGSDDGNGREHGDEGHEHGSDGHRGRGGEEEDGLNDSGRDSGGPGPSGQSGHGGRGPGRHDSGEERFDEDHSEEKISGGSHSGRHGSSDGSGSGNSESGSGGGERGGGSGDSGGGNDGLDGGRAGSGSGRSGGSDGGGSDSGGRGPAPATAPPPTLEPPPEDLGEGSGGSGSGDDGSGSRSSGSGGGDDS